MSLALWLLEGSRARKRFLCEYRCTDTLVLLVRRRYWQQLLRSGFVASVPTSQPDEDDLRECAVTSTGTLPVSVVLPKLPLAESKHCLDYQGQDFISQQTPIIVMAAPYRPLPVRQRRGLGEPSKKPAMASADHRDPQGETAARFPHISRFRPVHREYGQAKPAVCGRWNLGSVV
ncbi:hypothetical protein B0T18DRAFT_390405 [Schizothecium vesticola]|uniref:Uncharacterized protein n=1 Tax=Schizothecium vesticola TaxID=314040 RepID=A0AA40EUX6_9PEZI|nr:hypothetical protein B0T18DRAFT_390405 [Schizothecium vesticola]